MTTCCRAHEELDQWHFNNQIYRSKWLEFYRGIGGRVADLVSNLTRRVNIPPPDIALMVNELIAEGGGDLIRAAVNKSHRQPCGSPGAKKWASLARALAVLV